MTLGKFVASVNWRGASTRCQVVVAGGNGGCLLGYSTATDLGIVNGACFAASHSPRTPSILDTYKLRFPTVFSGKIGRLKGHQIHLLIDESVKPVAQKQRLIPFHQREPLEAELNRRLELGIIEPGTGQPTDWVAQVVIAYKQGTQSIRLCTDGRDMNRAIKHERHLMPTLDDVVEQVHWAKFFAKLDMNSA